MWQVAKSLALSQKEKKVSWKSSSNLKYQKKMAFLLLRTKNDFFFPTFRATMLLAVVLFAFTVL